MAVLALVKYNAAGYGHEYASATVTLSLVSAIEISRVNQRLN